MEISSLIFNIEFNWLRSSKPYYAKASVISDSIKIAKEVINPETFSGIFSLAALIKINHLCLECHIKIFFIQKT